MRRQPFWKRDRAECDVGSAWGESRLFCQDLPRHCFLGPPCHQQDWNHRAFRHPSGVLAGRKHTWAARKWARSPGGSESGWRTTSRRLHPRGSINFCRVAKAAWLETRTHQRATRVSRHRSRGTAVGELTESKVFANGPIETGSPMRSPHSICPGGFWRARVTSRNRRIGEAVPSQGPRGTCGLGLGERPS